MSRTEIVPEHSQHADGAASVSGDARLSSDDALALVRLANLLQMSSIKMWHGLDVKAVVSEARSLANRIAQSTAADSPTVSYTDHDVTLLAEAGGHLMDQARNALEKPHTSPQLRVEAATRLSLGQELLSIRDKIAAGTARI